MKTIQRESIFSKDAFKPFQNFPEMLPIPFPELPEPLNPPFSEQEKAQFKVTFDNYENAFYSTIEKNRLRFEKAFPRMKRCSFLNGLLDPFALRKRSDFMHFSWCPCKVWQENFKQQRDIFKTIGE